MEAMSYQGIRIMKHIVLAFLLGVPVLCAQAVVAQGSTVAPDTAAVRAQIEANDHAVGRAVVAGDYAALEKLWAPNMVVNSRATTS